MSDLENEEVNHQLCTVAVDEMFDSWSLEIQEQVMAEWNDWRQDVATEAGLCCDECGRVFTRPDNLKRHIQSYNSGEKLFSCQECGKFFATKDKLNNIRKPTRRILSNALDATRNLFERCVFYCGMF
jgi:uncharacterized C2H2 Zn-finger protein